MAKKVLIFEDVPENWTPASKLTKKQKDTWAYVGFRYQALPSGRVKKFKYYRWARDFDYCIRCGRTKFFHRTKGLCQSCHFTTVTIPKWRARCPKGTKNKSISYLKALATIKREKQIQAAIRGECDPPSHVGCGRPRKQK
jgi:hypothetical protein